MSHELAHYFMGSPDVPDGTHDLVAIYGVGKWLPHPEPVGAAEASLFMRTLMALLSTFGLNKKEEDQIKEPVAELFSKPSAPVATPPITMRALCAQFHTSYVCMFCCAQSSYIGVLLRNRNSMKGAKFSFL